MFGYMSIAQLSVEIRQKLGLIPNDVDLIVGVPRSGMIPAHLIALYLNRLVIDSETFIRDGIPGHGLTREVGAPLARPFDARHVLLVDDSLASGASMATCVNRIAETGFAGKVTTCAIIVDPAMSKRVDIHFLQMPQPRMFEWNAFHHPYVERACFDLDGVLCCDPTSRENDDGDRYLEFMRNARPLFSPTRRIGHIVSARLEKYRRETEAWLTANDIAYGRLYLLDLPSRAERLRQGAHHVHKAMVYRKSEAIIFYESDPGQARDIAHLSGKPVLCVSEMAIYRPGGLHARAAVKTAKWHVRTLVGKAKARLATHFSGRSTATA